MAKSSRRVFFLALCAHFCAVFCNIRKKSRAKGVGCVARWYYAWHACHRSRQGVDITLLTCLYFILRSNLEKEGFGASRHRTPFFASTSPFSFARDIHISICDARSRRPRGKISANMFSPRNSYELWIFGDFTLVSFQEYRMSSHQISGALLRRYFVRDKSFIGHDFSTVLLSCLFFFLLLSQALIDVLLGGTRACKVR